MQFFIGSNSINLSPHLANRVSSRFYSLIHLSILRRVQSAGAGAEGDVHAFGYSGIYSGSGTMLPQMTT
jgi:hypothetical protein